MQKIRSKLEKNQSYETFYRYLYFVGDLVNQLITNRNKLIILKLLIDMDA